MGIGSNEYRDVLAKEAWDFNQTSIVTLDDANTAKRKTSNQSIIKPTIPGLNCLRNVSSTDARLRTRHFKGMKISIDNSRSYPICRNCPQTHLTPGYIFDCKVILASLFKLDASLYTVLKLQIWPRFYWGFWTNIGMHYIH
ncbi:hypothetical protein TNCV_1628491 [Trichonephila clavipes]|nr:hypothetical protein TNCV_1628491 [Trichonephila clavipes]